MGTEQVTAQFDATAGAIFGAFGVSTEIMGAAHDSGADTEPLTTPQFVYLLVAEALARHEDPDLAWRWITEQMRLAAWNGPLIFTALQAQLQHCWSSVLPIFLLPTFSRRDFWNSYQRSYGNEQHIALHQLLFALWDRYSANLFQPGDWLAEVKQSERYGTAELACTVKLGLTLKWLAEQSSGDERTHWEIWQQCLKEGVLHRLPERITRGFAPDEPLFEDMVLALLAVAEWLTFERPWRIGTFLADTDGRPSERLSAEQKVLAGALYGWQRGYRRVGNLVSSQQQRAALSRQAFCLALRNASVEQPSANLAESIVLHNTAQGTLSALLAPYLEFSRYEQQEIIEYDPVTHVVNTIKRSSLDLRLARQAFLFHLDLQP